MKEQSRKSLSFLEVRLKELDMSVNKLVKLYAENLHPEKEVDAARVKQLYSHVYRAVKNPDKAGYGLIKDLIKLLGGDECVIWETPARYHKEQFQRKIDRYKFK